VVVVYGDECGPGWKFRHALVPVVHGVVVHEYGLDLDHSQKPLVACCAVVNVAGDERVVRGDIEGDLVLPDGIVC